MAGGRPTKYQKKFCDAIVESLSKGRSITQFAAEIKVARDSIYTWEKKHTEFSDAIKKAEAASQAFWENVLMRAALGVKSDANKNPLNITALIFLMKNRFHDQYGDKSVGSTTPSATITLAYDPTKPLQPKEQPSGRESESQKTIETNPSRDGGLRPTTTAKSGLQGSAGVSTRSF